MAQIIDFPNANEREWRDLEELLRESYKNMPDGPATIEECLPAIKNAWKDIFVSFDVQPNYSIPGPLTAQQEKAIFGAVEQGVNLVAERLKSERSRCLGMLAVRIYQATFYRRNGEAP